MKLTTLFFIFMFCQILQSCKDDKTKYYYVAKETILPYQENDQIIFQNETGQLDTFVLFDVSHNIVSTGQADNAYKEFYEYLFKNINSSDTNNTNIILIGYNFYISILWNKNEFVSKSNTYDLKEFEVLGKKYENVKRIYTYDGNLIVDTLYYQYNYGVVQFYDSNDQTWKLKN